MEFSEVKDYGHCLPTGFILIVIFFNEAFEYGDGVKYWGYVGSTLNHSV
jgi:hypothetical protein